MLNKLWGAGPMDLEQRLLIFVLHVEYFVQMDIDFNTRKIVRDSYSVKIRRGLYAPIWGFGADKSICINPTGLRRGHWIFQSLEKSHDFFFKRSISAVAVGWWVVRSDRILIFGLVAGDGECADSSYVRWDRAYVLGYKSKRERAPKVDVVFRKCGTKSSSEGCTWSLFISVAVSTPHGSTQKTLIERNIPRDHEFWKRYHRWLMKTGVRSMPINGRPSELMRNGNACHYNYQKFWRKMLIWKISLSISIIIEIPTLYGGFETVWLNYSMTEFEKRNNSIRSDIQISARREPCSLQIYWFLNVIVLSRQGASMKGEYYTRDSRSPSKGTRRVTMWDTVICEWKDLGWWSRGEGPRGFFWGLFLEVFFLGSGNDFLLITCFFLGEWTHKQIWRIAGGASNSQMG